MTPPSDPDPVEPTMFAAALLTALRSELDKVLVPLGHPAVGGVRVHNNARNVQVEFVNGQMFDMHIREFGR